MGEARDVMDRVTAAVFMTRDLKAVADCYTQDAVAVTPDQGKITGRDGIAEYHQQILDAVPDARFESVAKHECGNVAIDEGYIVGTNTGPLAMPSGATIPATGKELRVRECDVAVVDGGVITEHRFYFDQMDLLGQLGLIPEPPA